MNPPVTQPSYVGHHDQASLPIKAGDRVTIPAGVTIRSFNPKRKQRVSTRRQTVEVKDILGGADTRASNIAPWDRGRYPGQDDVFAAFDLAMEAIDTETDPVRRRAIQDFAYGLRVPTSNPEVRWSGVGYYWTWADINDVLGTPKTGPDHLATLTAILNS